jgi:hypothetical protein
MTRGFVVSCLVIAGIAGGSGCSSAGEEVTGDEQNVTAGTCKVTNVMTRQDLAPGDVAKLGDPLAKLVLSGRACPQTFTELQQELDRVDDCKKTPFGLVTRLVSETSQVLGKPDSYRAVTSRGCNGRAQHSLLMSVFGIAAGADQLPKNVEVIAFDAGSKSFNYYALEEGKWSFFGNSRDFVKDGYTCDASGVCQANASKKTRCAGCHTGGGLIMKELEFPWVHWSGPAPMPGEEQIFKKFGAQFGNVAGGADLEFVVGEGGNGAWTPARVDVASELGAAEALRPVFCTLEINLRSADDAVANPRIPGDLLFNTRQWGAPPDFESADYKTLVSAFDQNINASRDGKGRKLGDDNVIPFLFPKRSFADGQYVRELLNRGIIDVDFLSDVQIIDFLQPAFSPQRCGLLKFAPKLGKGELTAANVKKGFIQNLAGAGDFPGAAQLLANLKNPDDGAAHKARVEKFLQACNARSKRNFTWDALTWATHLRNVGRSITAPGGQQIIEFGASLPFGTPVDSKNAPLPKPKGWFPDTCVLSGGIDDE